MKRIILISFQDVDVSKGLDQLLTKYPGAMVCFPITDGADVVFLQSVATTAIAHNSPIHCFVDNVGNADRYEGIGENKLTVSNNPLKELMRQITPDDIFAIVWEDSMECHLALHAIEDYGLESWDITDGLDPIEVDYSGHDPHGEIFVDMMETMGEFIEKMSLYITAVVLESLGKVLGENLDQLKDIDPFEE